jgi:hypothetical protein
VPIEVLGGGVIVMFGMVVAAGVSMLSDVNWNRRNMVIFAIALSLGLGLQLEPGALQYLPDTLKVLATSGILPAALIAIVLNLVLPEELPLRRPRRSRVVWPVTVSAPIGKSSHHSFTFDPSRSPTSQIKSVAAYLLAKGGAWGELCRGAATGSVTPRTRKTRFRCTGIGIGPLGPHGSRTG